MAFTTQWMVVAARRSSSRPRECDQSRYRHGDDPPPSRIQHVPTLLTCATMLLLCIAIVVQMLGVPITLLDTTGADDPFLDSLLTGYALPQAVFTVAVNHRHRLTLIAACLGPHKSIDHQVFHPPV